MKIDLHTHSTFSDGIETPEELLNHAKRNNIKIFAITDHDNIEGSKKLMTLDNTDMIIYSGVELSAKVEKGQMHILGYNIDLDNPELNKRLNDLHEMSINNIKLYINQLKDDFNIVLPTDEIDKLLSNKGNIGRPQLSLLLIKYGYCSSVSEAFDKYLKDDKVRKIKQTISKEECIRLINNAGGISSLAHPWTLKLSNEELIKEVEYLISIGLKGIEVIHSRNTDEMISFYHEIAEKYNLLETGGTDYHGESVKPGLELGTGYNNNVNIEEGTLSFTERIKSRYM